MRRAILLPVLLFGLGAAQSDLVDLEAVNVLRIICAVAESSDSQQVLEQLRSPGSSAVRTARGYRIDTPLVTIEHEASGGHRVTVRLRPNRLRVRKVFGGMEAARAYLQQHGRVLDEELSLYLVAGNPGDEPHDYLSYPWQLRYQFAGHGGGRLGLGASEVFELKYRKDQRGLEAFNQVCGG